MSVLSETHRATARETIFFGSLPEPVFDSVLKSSRVVSLHPGQPLFRQHEPSSAVFAVLEGMLKLQVQQKDGGEVVVETFHAGMSFAEALVFVDRPYPVSAVALVNSVVLQSPKSAFRSVLSENPDAIEPILTATYAHLHRLVHQIEELKSQPGVMRLGRYILASLPSSGDGGEVTIPFEKQVLASLLGMKPETLSRAFRKLRDYGVAMDGRNIEVKDRAALDRFLRTK